MRATSRIALIQKAESHRGSGGISFATVTAQKNFGVIRPNCAAPYFCHFFCAQFEKAGRADAGTRHSRGHLFPGGCRATPGANFWVIRPVMQHCVPWRRGSQTTLYLEQQSAWCHLYTYARADLETRFLHPLTLNPQHWNRRNDCTLRFGANPCARVAPAHG